MQQFEDGSIFKAWNQTAGVFFSLHKQQSKPNNLKT